MTEEEYPYEGLTVNQCRYQAKKASITIEGGSVNITSLDES
jgi:hypothetical protein